MRLDSVHSIRHASRRRRSGRVTTSPLLHANGQLYSVRMELIRGVIEMARIREILGQDSQLWTL